MNKKEREKMYTLRRSSISTFEIFADAHYDNPTITDKGEETAVQRLIKAGLIERNPTAKHEIRRTEKGEALFNVFAGKPRSKTNSGT